MDTDTIKKKIVVGLSRRTDWQEKFERLFLELVKIATRALISKGGRPMLSTHWDRY